MQSNRSLKQYTFFASALAVIGVLNVYPQFQETVFADTPHMEAPATADEQILVTLRQHGPETAQTVRAIMEKFGRVQRVTAHARTVSGVTGSVAAKMSPRADVVFGVQFDRTQDLAGVLQNIQRDPRVASAQWNYKYEPDVVPNDQFYSYQWQHPITQAPEAWDLETGDASVVIAVIGTGVKLNLTDLASQIWVNADETAGNGLDDDGNGFIDDVQGWDFYSSDNDPTDIDGHETGVAGVAAAAANNVQGVAGTCWGCRIMPLRIDYSTAEVAAAIDYAVANGAKIINMSFGSYTVGTYGTDSIVETAVSNAVAQGVLVIASVGNESTDLKRYPGALDTVLGVASTDANDARSAFSNWGDWVDISAPGTNVYTTTFVGYGSASGTSFSAPYVAGAAGLLFSRYPGLSIADARMILEYTADKLPNEPKALGSGRINTFRAVSSDQPPTLFAVIKKPNSDLILPATGTQEIWGTALGDSYVLEYKPETASTWTLIASGSQTVNGTLGTMDIDTMPSGEAYFEIRLTSTKGAQTDSHTVTVAREVEYLPGWPSSLFSNISAVTTADLDGNGTRRVIVGTDGGRVYVFEWWGGISMGWSKNLGRQYVKAAPAVGDIDGDGASEIVATAMGTSATGGGIFAYEKNGAVVVGWPKLIAGQPRGGAVLANIDADPAPEVIVAAAGNYTGLEANVYAFNGDGSDVPGWPYVLSEFNVQTTPVIGDVTGDGSPEIVVLTAEQVVILNANGTLAYSWTKSFSHVNPVLADVDLDGILDIVYRDGDGLYAYSGQGALKWQTPIAGYSFDQISAGDVIGDTRPEIFSSVGDVSGSDTGMVYGWTAQGQVLSGWPKAVIGRPVGEPIIGDADGDGSHDILVVTRRGRVYAWGVNGSLLPNFPKPLHSAVNASGALADIDGDGDVDFVSGSEVGKIYAWDLLGALAPNMPWPSSRHDANNSGALPTTVAPNQDTTPPTATLTSPTSGTVMGTVTMAADASDNVGVVSVEFFVDSVSVGIDASAPYSVSWNTAGLSAGSVHTLFARAADAAGNTGDSATTNVTTGDGIAPTVSVTSPSNGATVSGTVTISAAASDNVGVTSVQFFVDGASTGSDTTAPYSMPWNTTTFARNTTHTLVVRAYDAAGNNANSASVSVAVLDVTPPTVAITSPANGSIVLRSKNTTIAATAADVSGVTNVKFYVNNVLKCTDTTVPYSCVWAVPSGRRTNYTLKATALDAAGLTTFATIQVQSSN